MRFSLLFTCLSSLSLISGASIPTDKSGTCSRISSPTIDLGDEDSIDEKKLQQLNSHYEQNADCVDAVYDQNKQAFAGVSYIITHASSADYVTAMKALATYMRAVDAADTKGTLNQNFVNVSMVYLNSLPESFKVSEKTKRDFQEEQDPESSGKKHRFRDWVKKTNFSLRSKIGKLDHAQTSSLKSDSQFVRKNYKHIMELVKRNWDDFESGFDSGLINLDKNRPLPFSEELGHAVGMIPGTILSMVIIAILIPPVALFAILYFMLEALAWVFIKLFGSYIGP